MWIYRGNRYDSVLLNVFFIYLILLELDMYIIKFNVVVMNCFYNSLGDSFIISYV